VVHGIYVDVQARASDKNAAVVYRHSDISNQLLTVHNGQRCLNLSIDSSHSPTVGPPEDARPRPRQFDGLVCNLMVVVDHTYFQQIAGSVMADAVARVTQHVAQADFAFRSTDMDLDGVPDNIGFVIDDIRIYSSTTSNDYRLSDTSLGVIQLLDRFCTYDFDRFCLAIAFTDRDFGQCLSCYLSLYWPY